MPNDQRMFRNPKDAYLVSLLLNEVAETSVSNAGTKNVYPFFYLVGVSNLKEAGLYTGIYVKTLR